MSHDNVFALENPAVPNEVRDALTEVLRGRCAQPDFACLMSWALPIARSQEQNGAQRNARKLAARPRSTATGGSAREERD